MTDEYVEPVYGTKIVKTDGMDDDGYPVYRYMPVITRDDKMWGSALVKRYVDSISGAISYRRMTVGTESVGELSPTWLTRSEAADAFSAMSAIDEDIAAGSLLLIRREEHHLMKVYEEI